MQPDNKCPFIDLSPELILVVAQLKYLIASVPKAGAAEWAVKPLNWFGKLPRIVWERPVFPVACFPLHIMGIDSLFFFPPPKIVSIL